MKIVEDRKCLQGQRENRRRVYMGQVDAKLVKQEHMHVEWDMLAEQRRWKEQQQEIQQ